ncbi:MAG: PIG-L family deacetylase [Balneolaceae bacterium]|nr:PIG-L family deacetylase [Balneolaceae bacterium]
MDEKNSRNVALAVVAHPDDIEFLCAGTLALLRKRGWTIEMATMTAGDCGTRELSPEKISSIRKAEAEKSADMLDAGYHCLEMRDGFVMYDEDSLREVVKLVRRVRPALVFAMSPSCYMVDHEMSSKLVQTAVFTAGMKNIATGNVPPFFHVPHLYYMDPMEGKNKFGQAIEPGIVVDISSVIGTKEAMLKCHDSQRQWLLDHHGMDQYTENMKQLSAERGSLADVDFGEGFRQHLGHGYPQDDLLISELGDQVHLV